MMLCTKLAFLQKKLIFHNKKIHGASCLIEPSPKRDVNFMFSANLWVQPLTSIT